MGNGTKHGAGRKKHREHSAQRARHGGKSRKPAEQKKEQTSKARNRNNKNSNSGNISPAKRQGNHHQDNNNASITSTSNNDTSSATLTERVAEVLRAELPETHPALHIPSPVIAQKKTAPPVGRTPTPTSNINVASTTAAAQVELLRAVRASVLQAVNATTTTTTSLRSPTQGNEVTTAPASRNSPVTLSRGVTPPHNNITTTSTSRNHNICTPAPVLGSSASFGSSMTNVTRQGRHSPPLMNNNTSVSSGSTRTRTVYKTQPPSLLASAQGAQQQPALPDQETNRHNDNRVVVSAQEPTSRLSAPIALRAQVTAAEAAEDSASLNSSFSETAQSATRTGSCRSYILPARTNKSTAEGNTTMNSPELPDGEVVNNNEEDEDDVDSVYDEEDEEQAVQQYMDSWVAPTRPRSSHSADTTHTQRNDSTEGSGSMKIASTGRAGSRAEAESDTDLQMLLRRRHPITTATLSPLERGTPSPQLTPPILPQPGLFASLVQPALPKTMPEVRNPTTSTSSSTTVTRSSGNHNNSSGIGGVHESATVPGSARRSLLELGEVAMITAETSPPVQPVTTGAVHTRRAAMHEGTSYHSSRSPANSQVTLSGSAAPSTSVSQPQQQQQSKTPAFISVAGDLASRPGPHPNTETITTNTTSTSTSKSGKSASHSHGGSPAQHVAEFKQDGLCPVDTLSAIPPLPHLIGPTTSTTTSTTPAVGCIPPLPTELSAESCRQLSLYDCFVLDAQRQVWLVDDAVLAKCLEYIRLMAYEHPMLAHDKAAHRPSIWSSSASVPAPLRAVAAESGTPSACSTIDGVCRRAIRRSTAPVLCRAAVCNLDTLFLEQAEAMRWLVQQEYVIATLLACCARAKPHGVSGRHGGATNTSTAPFLHAAQAQAVGNDKREHSNRHTGHQPTHPSWKDNTNTIASSVAKSQPCIPAHMHPIHWVAQLVLRKFAQWGDFADFAQLWESQVRLVLCSAAPSHQRSFVASDDGLIFRSDFEGGNLLRVERAVEPYLYYLWLEPDCGSDKRIWFRFSIEGAREGRPLRFRLLNAAPHSKLYCENHMQPVWRDGARQPFWAPVDQCSFRTANNDLDGEVSFAIVPRSSSDTIQVAFCAPYTYADLLCHLCHWHNLLRSSVQSIRFEEKVLCRTPEGRKLHLLIISSYAEKSVHGGGGHHATNRANNNNNNITNNNTGNNNNSTSTGMSAVGHGKPRHSDVVHGPYANFQSGKKVILISGRVHPGEITASHGLHGLISFLLSSDPRAAQLREHFIFFIVPMLNPDGVSRGHSRMDQYGTNLNRCYNDPDPVTQPTVHALRRLFEYLQRVYRENFIMYLDFHSHASKSNAFMFGNCLPRAVQHWNLVFPKLVELHARDLFSFPLCRFTWSGMLSKDGASRVLFGAGLIHSYTIELPHFTDRRLFVDSLRSLNSGRPPCFNEPTGPGASAASSPLAALTIALNLPPTALVTGNAESATSATNVVTAGSITVGKGNAKHHNSNAAVESAEGAAHGADGVPTADKITTVTPARRATHNTQGSKAKPRVHRAASASVATQRADSTSRLSGRRGRRSVSSSQRPAVSTLREITEPCVLRQSALVGQACMLALLDYCSLNPRFSPELISYGGMERVLTEVKRQIKKSRAPASGNAVSPTAAMQPIYRQY